MSLSPFALGACVGALAVGVLVLTWPHPAPPALPPLVTRAADSLALTRAADSVRMDSLGRVATAAVARADSAARRAHVADVRSRVARAHADSLAIEAVRRDTSATPWRTAYAARTVEADSLRSATAHLDSAVAFLHAALADTSAQLGIARGRLAATDALNRQLASAARSAGQCRLVFGIPCPTRGAMFVGGLVAGGALVALAR